jgi:hypothetical protein
MRPQLLLLALPVLAMALPTSSPKATTSVLSTSEDNTFIWRRGEAEESRAVLSAAEDRIFTWRRGKDEERATLSTAEDRSFTWRRGDGPTPEIADDDSIAHPQVREEIH